MSETPPASERKCANRDERKENLIGGEVALPLFEGARRRSEEQARVVRIEPFVFASSDLSREPLEFFDLSARDAHRDARDCLELNLRRVLRFNRADHFRSVLQNDPVGLFG